MKLNKTYNIFLFTIMIAILFEPILFIKYSFFNYLYIFGSVISLILILLITIKKNVKIDALIVLIILLRLMILIPTIIYSNGDFMKWGYLSIIVVTLFLILNYICRINYRLTTYILFCIFFILLFFNLVSYVFFPNGIYYDSNSFQSLFLLGIRTRFTDYAYTGLVLTELNYTYRIISKKVYFLSLVVCLLNVLLPKISTAIIAFLLFFIIKTLLQKNKFKRFITYNRGLIMAMSLNVSIIVFNVQKIFNNLFVKFFNKTANLTGRTDIWDKSWEIIFQKPFLGYGTRNDGSFIYIRDKMWQAHNQIIQTLYDGGIIGVILFLFLLYKCGENLKLKGSKNDITKIIFISGLTGFFIIMITEINSYYLPLYLVLFLGYFIKFDKKEI